MKRNIKSFLYDTQGATAIEYSLIASLIAVIIIAAVALTGTSLGTVYNTIAGSM